MLDILKVVRYVVFVIFVICNAVITSIAVWNLSIVQAVALESTSKQVDAFLIFVGVSGLILVFPILFIELFGKETFLSKVWFELSWVGLFWVLELVGASTITSQSDSQLCEDRLQTLAKDLGHDSPCTSAQVLQAFTWICAILLFGYFGLLSISTVLRYKSDRAIFHCSLPKFPWLSGGLRQLSSTPQSPSKEKFDDDEAPRIVAPKPQLPTIPFSEAFVSHRRGISQDYDIEHFQFPAPASDKSRTTAGPSAFSPIFSEVERPVPALFDNTMGTGLSTHVPPGAASGLDPAVIRTLAPMRSNTLYPSYMQNSTIPQPVPGLGRRTPPRAAPPVTLPTTRPSALTLISSVQPQQRKPAESLPSPIEEWPRIDAVTRPMAAKLKPKILPLPNSNLPSSSTYTFDPAALTAALEPLASSTHPSRSRPSGPRIRSGTGPQLQLQPQRRPPDLDLSNISNLRSGELS